MSKFVWTGGETSRPENGHELRARMGLQFFAEGESAAEGGADMGDAGNDAFLGGLLDSADDEPAGADGGDQIGRADGSGEDGGAAGGDQTGSPGGTGGAEETTGGEGQPPTEEQPPAEGQTAGQEPTPPPEVAELRFKDARFNLPGAAVRAISGALGQDALTLLQKGLNYENQGARERAILADYAEIAGIPVADYLSRLEQAAAENKLSAEVERLRGQYPQGTPDEALRTIAQNNLQQQRAQAQVRENARRLAAQQETARAQREARQGQMLSDIRAFKAAHPDLPRASDIPQAVWDIVNRDGVGLNAAWDRHQAEQLRAENDRLKQQLAAEQKMSSNRRQSAGSQQGGGDEHDPFLAAFMGE